ncbi:MAG: hypothetical protein E7Z85_04200 [Methanosphaera stadtmanae]|nr:hypothetical protein [Methanosphaera stadtmanae]
MSVEITVNVTDVNTGANVIGSGVVTIGDEVVSVVDGVGKYTFIIEDTTPVDGETLTFEFSSEDYETVSNYSVVKRDIIPTSTVVSDVVGSVGVPVTITAAVASDNERPVSQGKVTFKFNGEVIGTDDTVVDGVASIDYTFTSVVTDGVVVAEYVDDCANVIFGDSSSESETVQV